jgi:hypothetical protein
MKNIDRRIDKDIACTAFNPAYLDYVLAFYVPKAIIAVAEFESTKFVIANPPYNVKK